MSKFTRVFLIGPMGAGKSTIGMKLSVLLNLEFVDLDLLLEQQHLCSMADIVQLHGEDFFRCQESLLLETATQRSNILLATGGGSILQANNRQLLKERGLVCYLKVTPQEQLRRLDGSTTRPLLPKNYPQRFEYLVESLQQRAPLYESCADIVLDAETATPDALAHDLKNSINRHICV